MPWSSGRIWESWPPSSPSGAPPVDPILGALTRHTNLLIQADLKAAGIPYRDGSDRGADFHGLRHSYITALAMSRAPVKVIQSLTRHSTPTLTLGVYAHVGIFDQTAALDALPGTAPTGPATEAGRLAATGTDGPINPNPPLPVPYGGDGRGRIVSGSGRFDDVRTGGYESDSHAPEPDTLPVFDATGRV